MPLKQRLRRAWWPLGPASVMAPAVAIVGVVVTMTWPMLGWPYPLWVQTSAQFHQQFAWAGLIAGASACWSATVVHPKDRIWTQPGAPRAGSSAVTRHLTVLVGWFVGAYLVALLPLVVSTVAASGIGAPDPLAILSGVLAMVTAVALGYALGTAIPSPVIVPIVAVGFYALLVAGKADGEHYATVAPVLDVEPELGQRESLPLLVFRIALFVAITSAAAAFAAKSMNRKATGTVQPQRVIADVATHFAVPGLLIVVSLIRQPVVYTADHPVAVCTELREIRYCVHSVNQPRLAELVHFVDPMIARFGSKPTNLDQIWDYALTHHPIDADLAHGLEIAWLNPDGTIQTQIADTIAGVHACAITTSVGQDRQDEAAGLTRLTADVSDYLSTGTPSGTLAAMSVADVQQWITQHKEQLHTCKLAPDQLPGALIR